MPYSSTLSLSSFSHSGQRQPRDGDAGGAKAATLAELGAAVCHHDRRSARQDGARLPVHTNIAATTPTLPLRGGYDAAVDVTLRRRRVRRHGGVAWRGGRGQRGSDGVPPLSARCSVGARRVELRRRRRRPPSPALQRGAAARSLSASPPLRGAARQSEAWRRGGVRVALSPSCVLVHVASASSRTAAHHPPRTPHPPRLTLPPRSAAHPPSAAHPSPPPVRRPPIAALPRLPTIPRPSSPRPLAASLTPPPSPASMRACGLVSPPLTPARAATHRHPLAPPPSRSPPASLTMRR